MASVTCRRCGRTTGAMSSPPYPDEIGLRIQRSICPSCWSDYMRRQTMVINEYRLDLMDPKAQDVLTRDMLEFLGLEQTGGEAAEAGGLAGKDDG